VGLSPGHVIVEHVVVPDHAEERVREPSEEWRAKRNSFVPSCPREERVEPDLIVEDDR
jgi:hypothetical protein